MSSKGGARASRRCPQPPERDAYGETKLPEPQTECLTWTVASPLPDYDEETGIALQPMQSCCQHHVSAPIKRAMKPLTYSERYLLAGTALLLLLALNAPALTQDQAYHQFADSRTLLGVPRALDVLSNAAFVVSGLAGLAMLATGRLVGFSGAMRRSAYVCFAGFVFTSLGSGYYHLSPDDAGLGWDRLGMVVAFAGVLGMVASQRVSRRAGSALLSLTLVAGPASVWWWAYSDSVTPYAVLQFGGMLMAMLCLLAPARGAGPRWVLLLVAYTLAKVTESFDAEIFVLTGEVVSGHTLKHLLAAVPALAVMLPRSPAPVVPLRVPVAE